jgi:hypothetical protein
MLPNSLLSRESENLCSKNGKESGEPCLSEAAVLLQQPGHSQFSPKRNAGSSNEQFKA